MESEFYLLIAAAVGFGVGYAYRALHEAREDMDAFQRGMGAGMAAARAEHIITKKDPA